MVEFLQLDRFEPSAECVVVKLGANTRKCGVPSGSFLSGRFQDIGQQTCLKDLRLLCTVMNKFYPLLVYEFPIPEAAKLVSFSRLDVLMIYAAAVLFTAFSTTALWKCIKPNVTH